MPDLFLYLSALALATGGGAVAALAVAGPRPPASAARTKAACVLAVGAGLALGGSVLRLPISWPPASGLGRLLVLVLPVALGIELLSAYAAVPRWLAWCGRLALAMSSGPMLLHASVYVAGDKPQWSAMQAASVHVLSGGLLTCVWAPLTWLSRRAGDVAIPLALAQTALCGGLAMMLSGYVSGGAAGLLVAGALTGCVVASGMRKFPSGSFEGAIGVGIVALFGLLFIGHFFGRLSTGRTLAIFLAPLLGWITELPALRRQPVWRVCVLRLVLVAIPLIAVLVLAKRDFDRDLLPLLARETRRS